MIWAGVIESEKEYFNLIHSRLEDLAKSAKASSHPDLEQIYAGVKHSYEIGIAHLEGMITHLTSLQRSIEVGELPAPHKMDKRMSPARKRASLYMMGGMRCMQPRPREIFHQELRKQSKAFMQKINGLVTDQKVHDRDLEIYVQNIVPILCEMDLPMMASQIQKDPIFPKVIRNMMLVSVGWGAKAVWDKNKPQMFGDD